MIPQKSKIVLIIKLKVHLSINQSANQTTKLTYTSRMDAAVYGVRVVRARASAHKSTKRNF